MKPLSNERPKALMPILDVPQMSWHLSSLSSCGVSNLWVNCHFDVDMIQAEVHRLTEALGIEAGISLEEKEPLGTAGALRKLSDHLTDTILVVNSDIACDVPLERLLEAHRSSAALATLLAIPSSDRADLVVEEGWVTGLINRQDLWQTGHIYGGMGVFDKKVLELIPPDGPSGLYETVFLGGVEAGHPFAALEWGGYWMDVGDPSALLRINLDALSGGFERSRRPVGLSGPAVRDDATAFVGAEAVVEEVELRHSVVGKGSRVEPGSKLERCVVWDGAEVARGRYRNSIITGAAVVEVD